MHATVVQGGMAGSTYDSQGECPACCATVMLLVLLLMMMMLVIQTGLDPALHLPYIGPTTRSTWYDRRVAGSVVGGFEAGPSWADSAVF